MKIKNVFTEKEYEAIQYNNNFQEVKDFIRSKIDVGIYMIQPNIRVFGLNSIETITDIKKSDWIIRRNGMYKIISNDIKQSNFMIL